jgi:hydrogenase maturation factor
LKPRFGKTSKSFLADVVFRNLGARNRSLVVGPGIGLDNAILALGRGRVLVVTSDPVSVIPAMGMELSAWLSVHLIASDYATSGLNPEFGAFTFNFPPEMNDQAREQYLRAIGTECRKLGIAMVSGHTGSYPGSQFTVVGGAVMFGFGREGGYVTPAMARAGDVVLMTKHAAIEATASLAHSFPQYVEAKIGKNRAGAARKMVRLCSTVDDAKTAARVGLGKGGVTSMHDATEGGVLGALEEMASASGRAFVINRNKIPVSAEAKEVCAAFKIDPLTSLSEGVLLITCNPRSSEDLKRQMSKAKIETTSIGSVRPGSGLWISGSRGPPSPEKPSPDRYFEAYGEAVAHRLK